mmetsp:Transcript_13271/g.23613  ORF Transcript_13271/g.23613 Transcript_13271/m.23613 type:complete len:341 (+) Transcript_13271:273-1295(+)|eukprot:CAMPEP_0184518504 /NCGR_PEP_ID=MMETSP0198_2-20121128/6122_1 /TAXON_ID=1112570 /ORGANISM="Thraustochytrium sp., Strain LLF1b" /LENGTH=340 /DNA_ID=CAMNT_0026908945 /DNA_START=143 /DNA_END=1165 /DNA_ORIENTATION=-
MATKDDVVIDGGLIAKQLVESESLVETKELSFSDDENEDDDNYVAFSWGTSKTSNAPVPNANSRREEDTSGANKKKELRGAPSPPAKALKMEKSSSPSSKHYPANTAFTPSESLMAIENDVAWLRQAVGDILDDEIRNCVPVYEAAKPKLLTRLRAFQDKIKRKVASLRDIEEILKAAPPKYIQNPKNAQLLMEQKSLEKSIATIHLELAEWSRVEKDRLAKQTEQLSIAEAQTTDSEIASEDVKDASLSKAENRGESLEEPQEQTEAAATPWSLKSELEEAASQVEFVNVKLRSLKHMASMGEDISSKVAKLCEGTAFKAYTDIDKPQKVIKALAGASP